MANTYDIGDQVRLSVTFATVAGTSADPTTVTVYVKSPVHTTAYVYGTDVEVIKATAGNYYIDITPDRAGFYVGRWVGTGALIAAEEHYIQVRRKSV